MRISEYTGYLRRFGPIYTVKEVYYRFFSNVLERHSRLKRDKDTFCYLKRYLREMRAPSFFAPLRDIPPRIWTCWLQGYEQAPPVVKACINSMRKYAPGYEVTVITEDTIADYVAMPAYITKKYKDGIISATQFSDLLRILLLINYGGIWMDATVLLTKNIPPVLLETDFFVFQTSLLHFDLQPCSSWFIIARRNHPVLLKMFAVLAAYWKKNNYLINYFIFHVTVQLVITYDHEANELWHRMYYKNNSDPHLLQKKLFDTMDMPMRDYIWDLSFAHKLTYKFSDESLIKRGGTFYRYILDRQPE
jgi:mannosyltransferase OCH1-like enzyme